MTWRIKKDYGLCLSDESKCTCKHSSCVQWPISCTLIFCLVFFVLAALSKSVCPKPVPPPSRLPTPESCGERQAQGGDLRMGWVVSLRSITSPICFGLKTVKIFCTNGTHYRYVLIKTVQIFLGVIFFKPLSWKHLRCGRLVTCL